MNLNPYLTLTGNGDRKMLRSDAEVYNKRVAKFGSPEAKALLQAHRTKIEGHSETLLPSASVASPKLNSDQRDDMGGAGTPTSPVGSKQSDDSRIERALEVSLGPRKSPAPESAGHRPSQVAERRRAPEGSRADRALKLIGLT
jgi:hypothetical protein